MFLRNFFSEYRFYSVWVVFSCFCPNFLLKKYCGNPSACKKLFFLIRKFDFIQVCPVQRPFSWFWSLVFLQNSAFISLHFYFFLPTQQIFTVSLEYVENCPGIWDSSSESAPCGSVLTHVTSLTSYLNFTSPIGINDFTMHALAYILDKETMSMSQWYKPVKFK